MAITVAVNESMKNATKPLKSIVESRTATPRESEQFYIPRPFAMVMVTIIEHTTVDRHFTTSTPAPSQTSTKNSISRRNLIGTPPVCERNPHQSFVVFLIKLHCWNEAAPRKLK